jgi:Ca2+-binding EF-hand superfamily protein
MTNASELGTTDAILDNIFKEIDTNKDGRISFKEFRNGSKTIPMMINLLQCNPDPESEG